MFKKKSLPAGLRFMHYAGLPGVSQDAACFMEQTADALIFRTVEGAEITLPLAKVNSLDLMDERNYAARYRGTGPNTSRTNAVKWYAVFTYDESKRLVFWYLRGKESTALYELKKHLPATGQSITL